MPCNVLMMLLVIRDCVVSIARSENQEINETVDNQLSGDDHPWRPKLGSVKPDRKKRYPGYVDLVAYIILYILFTGGWKEKGVEGPLTPVHQDWCWGVCWGPHTGARGGHGWSGHRLWPSLRSAPAGPGSAAAGVVQSARCNPSPAAAEPSTPEYIVCPAGSISEGRACERSKIPQSNIDLLPWNNISLQIFTDLTTQHGFKPIWLVQWLLTCEGKAATWHVLFSLNMKTNCKHIIFTQHKPGGNTSYLLWQILAEFVVTFVNMPGYGAQWWQAQF